MKNKIYVYSINPLNFIFCLVLRIKYKIIYDRSENKQNYFVYFKTLTIWLNFSILKEKVSSYAFENVRKIKNIIR